MDAIEPTDTELAEAIRAAAGLEAPGSSQFESLETQRAAQGVAFRYSFDFDGFSPNYYWSYYGYYDYYSRPWWQDWNRNPWWGPSVPGAPGEPPSQRPGRRSNDATPPPANLGGYGGGGAIYAPNPTPTTPGNPPPPEVKQPIGPAVKNPPAPTPPVEDNTQKRNGRRRK